MKRAKRNKTPTMVAQENYERYQYAREQSHDDYIEKATLCSKFFFSDQWDEADVDKLRKQHRPHLTINRIKPVILDMTGEYLVHRADVKFIPGIDGDEGTARALTKMYTHISNEQDFSAKEMTLWMDGVITSRAYYDIRVEFDDNYLGEIRLSVPNPKNVIPDPDADEEDPSSWNEVTQVYNLTELEIEEKYGKRLAKEVRQGAQDYHTYTTTEEESREDSFGRIPFQTDTGFAGTSDDENRSKYFVIDRQYYRIESVRHFVDQVNGDFRKIPQHWTDQQIAAVLEMNPDIEIEERSVRVIRWTVTCGSVVLFDDLSPYRTFTIVPFFPLFWRGKTAGGVEDLIDPQRNYNKTRSQELHIVNGTANGGWKVKKGALTNMTTEDLEHDGAKTGIVLEFKDDPKEIERIQPVNIPQGIDRISGKAERDIQAISSIDDEARGVARADVAGKAIGARREAAVVSLSPIFEALARTRRRLAKKVLELLQDYYTEERRVRVASSGLQASTEDVEINVEDEESGSIVNDVTLGEYSVVVTPAPVRQSEEEMQFEELRQMQQELGIAIPAHLFIEYSHLSNKPEIVEMIKALNGMAEPSEEEKELQQMQQELEMEEKRASIMARQAQAQLSSARAKKVLAEIENMDLDDANFEKLMLEARKLDNERWHNEQSIEIRRRAQEAQEAKMLMDDDNTRTKLDREMDSRRVEDNQSRGSEQ